MKIFRALLAGILGALAMSLAMYLLRLGGINVNLEALLGTLIEPPAGLSTWTAGLAIHLVIGAVASVVYATMFEMAVQRSGPVVGAGLGLCHGLLAGLMMSGIPAMNPLALGTQSAPGPFLQNLHYGPFVFVLLHILFGAVVGTAYGPPLQKPHLYTNRAA
jgi:hypothetical protein